MKLSYKGVRINADIKGSALSAQRASENDWHKNTLYIWSQLSDNDFGNSFHISTKLAEEKARDVRLILDDSLHWINSKTA
jgi:hypothetical protein